MIKTMINGMRDDLLTVVAKRLIVNGKWLIVKNEKTSCNNYFD